MTATLPITATLGDKEMHFALLSVNDLFVLSQRAGQKNMDLAALKDYCHSPIGAIQVLLISAAKEDKTLTSAEVETWGTILTRNQLSSHIFYSSVTAGGEVALDVKPQ